MNIATKTYEAIAAEFAPCQACSNGDHTNCVPSACDCADAGHYGNTIRRYVESRVRREARVFGTRTVPKFVEFRGKRFALCPTHGLLPGDPLTGGVICNGLSLACG